MTPRPPLPLSSAEIEAIQARFAVKVCSALEEQAHSVAPDIAARLRAGRERALGHGRISLARATARRPALAGAPHNLQSEDSPVWLRLAAVLPLLLLIAGLAMVHFVDLNERINAAAEVDAALLADDLPPAAYADPGFAEYLRDSSTGPH